jgi:argininosuccinate lyase
MIKAAFEIVNQNPLGSAAGYGSSFPLDRQMTTDLLGFKSPNYNVVYAQMTRGKSEKAVATGLSYLAATLNKLSMDVCLYMGQNYNFFTFPDELTTGSSIMPHKKNPDVFELIRANCNRLQALPNELALLLANLPTGYHRDLQLLKECIVPAIHMVKECLSITTFMLTNIKINQHIIDDPKYDYLFTVEKVNELVLKGVPFRDAYMEVGKTIEKGTYVPNRKVKHTHMGSIGNLANDAIKSEYNAIIDSFGFTKINETLEELATAR